MDDGKFDKFIKGRLEGYEDPAFDSSALEGFHVKLTSFRPMPWYESKLTHYWLAASLVLFTAVNAYIFWPSERISKDSSKTGISQQVIIDSLTVVIRQLQRPDDTLGNSPLQKSNATLQADQNNFPPHRLRTGAIGLYIGSVSELSPDIYHTLILKKMLVIDNGDAYLINPERPTDIYLAQSQRRLNEGGKFYSWPDVEIKIAEADFHAVESPSIIARRTQQEVSAKTRTLIEKHYAKGIGINVGPRVDISQMVFSSGSGNITPRVGLAVDWILSPVLSLETGFDYSAPLVNYGKDFLNYTLPAVDQSLGKLENLQVRNSLLSTPISVKYRHWISEKGQAFVKAGYTPYFSFNQEYQYRYDFDRRLQYGSSPDPDQDHHVNAIQETNDHFFYGSTGNISMGLMKTLRNSSKLEASVFYEKSLGDVGQQNIGMQLFGLRTAYWFNVR